jgi:hypothetical protein
MKTFSIYSKNTDQNNTNPTDLIILKDGFCVEAFIFGPLWALYKKLWIIGIISVLILTVSYNINNIYSSLLSDFIEELVLFAYGFLAYDILDYKLNKTGYKLQDIVIANSHEEAELIHLRKINNNQDYVQSR